MTIDVARLSLAVEAARAIREAPNFRPQTWPPNDAFPIVVDGEGKTISRYGDPIWDLTSWAGKAAILDFGNGATHRGHSGLDIINSSLLRQVTAWWLYGSSAVQTAQTLRGRFYQIRKLFVLCASNGIAASELVRCPRVADQIPHIVAPGCAGKTLALLHMLHEDREQLGFTLLDREGLVRLEAALPEHFSRQTAYMPPRIWSYQIKRLRAFLDDFNDHSASIEACFLFCLDAYAHNSGSVGEACRVGRHRNHGPFWTSGGSNGKRTGRVFHGPFSSTAERFGIYELLKRWCVSASDADSGKSLSVRCLSSYFSAVAYVGLAYILNFTLMRKEEGLSLRSDCLQIEDDVRFGPLYVIRGTTTKTIDDDAACWPTSPSVKVAIDAMTCVARLRMMCAIANPDVPAAHEEETNPYLLLRPYEPWGSRTGRDLRQPLRVRPNILSYQQVANFYPTLLKSDELRITRSDMEMALVVDPTLDQETFKEGGVWPIGWHQLRRTGAVNMLASGLVSDASLQYLLKHVSRSCSLYYGQGYSRVRLNDSARAEYVRTMYEILGKKIAQLLSDQFISPHGAKRKLEILRVVEPTNSYKLNELAKSGAVAWRETLLGGCTRREPCPYGGVDNIAYCGGGLGGRPCADALYDRDQEPAMLELSEIIRARLDVAPDDSPYRASLEAQMRSIDNALATIRTERGNLGTI